MIDFACKRFELDEVIKCGLGLTKSDFMIMHHLIKSRERLTSLEISEKLDVDVSTAQRSLKKLNEKNIVKRFQTNLANGGYLYSYEANSKLILRKIILEVIHGWTKKVENELETW